MHRHILIGLVMGAGLGLGVVATAKADPWAGAVEHCQGSLPSFEGALRKRPLGIANEGTTTAFVGCSLRIDTVNEADAVQVLVTNRGTSSANMSCTLVSGVAPPFPTYTPVYVTKLVSVAPGANNVIGFGSTDNNGNSFVLPNLNCQVVPGMEINVLQVTEVPQ